MRFVNRRILGFTLLPLLLAGGAFASGAEPDATAAANAFGLDLYQRLRARGENLFFSPASAAYALAMARTGAAGATAAGMDRVLHLQGDPDATAAAFGALMDDLLREREHVELDLANRLYGQEGFGFAPAFLDRLERRFGAALAQVDFRGDPEAARAAINAWVAGRTRERIDELLPAGSLDAATRLVLVNAIYFLGTWRTAFPADATADGPFHREAGGDADVPFMHLTGRFGYAERGGVQLLALPYEGGDLEMVLALPPAGTPLVEVEAGLDADALADWLAAPAPRQVAVAMPRLHLETKFDLATTLGAMGMGTAFTRRADFSPMTGGANGLAIDDVYHQAWLDVDEQGTEAAAATGLVMRVTSAQPTEEPVVFRADRPFVLAIRHVPSGAVLFLGRVADPS